MPRETIRQIIKIKCILQFYMITLSRLHSILHNPNNPLKWKGNINIYPQHCWEVEQCLQIHFVCRLIYIQTQLSFMLKDDVSLFRFYYSITSSNYFEQKFFFHDILFMSGETKQFCLRSRGWCVCICLARTRNQARVRVARWEKSHFQEVISSVILLHFQAAIHLLSCKTVSNYLWNINSCFRLP